MIQLYFNWTVLKNAIAAGKTCYKNNLLRKRGLLAHTSAAFLKNCCTEKRFICASHKPFTLLFPYRYAIMKQISERSICLCIAYSSPSLPWNMLLKNVPSYTTNWTLQRPTTYSITSPVIIWTTEIPFRLQKHKIEEMWYNKEVAAEKWEFRSWDKENRVWQNFMKC